MKKLCLLLLCALLLLPAVALAEDDPNASQRTRPLLVDEGDLLTEAEEIAMEEELERISTEQKCDVVVLIPASLGYKSATEYADDFYDDNNYGYGPTKDGILLLVCMEERDWATSTAGAAQDWFDDDTLTTIENGFLPKLSDGDYLAAFVNFSTRCEYVLKQVDRRPVLYLDDAAGMLSASEAAAVTRKLEGYSHVGYYCDTVVLTAASLDGKTAKAYAAALSETGEYRYGAERDKVVLVVDLSAGMCYCFTEGSASQYFSDDDLHALETAAAEKLSTGDIAGAFTQFGESAYSQIRAYFEAQGGYNFGGYGGTQRGGIVWFSLMRLVIALGVGAIAGAITAGALSSKLKSVRQQTEAGCYVVKDSFRLTDKQDLYLYSNVTKVVRQSDSGSRSSGGGHSGGSHFSSGGFSHGGHSGKF